MNIVLIWISVGFWLIDYNVFHCRFSPIRRDLDRDELSAEAPEIDIDMMIMKPLLIDGVYKIRMSWFFFDPVATGMRFKT